MLTIYRALLNAIRVVNIETVLIAVSDRHPMWGLLAVEAKCADENHDGIIVLQPSLHLSLSYIRIHHAYLIIFFDSFLNC